VLHTPQDHWEAWDDNPRSPASKRGVVKTSKPSSIIHDENRVVSRGGLEFGGKGSAWVRADHTGDKLQGLLHQIRQWDQVVHLLVVVEFVAGLRACGSEASFRFHALDR